MKKLSTVTMLLFAAILFSATGVFAQMPDLGTVSGSVVDQNTNDPIQYSMVAVINPDGHHRPVAQGATDEAGNYTLDVPYGEYIVVAHAFEYVPEYWEEVSDPDEATAVTVDEDSNPEGINFTLAVYEGPTFGTLAGAVYDAETEEPLADAVVSIHHVDNYHVHQTTRTDESGNYYFEQVLSGEYIVSAAAIDYIAADYEEPVEVIEDDVTGIDFYLAPILYGSISGMVYDAATEEPLADARVIARMPGYGIRVEALTAEDGSYTLADLPTGEYELHAAKQGYERLEYAEPVAVNGDDIMDIDFGLTFIQVGGISGMVYDAATGDPIEHALVMAIGDGQGHHHHHRWAITDENGEYMMELTSGEYNIEVYAWWYMPFSSEEPVEVVDDIVTYNVAMNGLEFGTVSGTVYNDSEEPIEHALVDIHMVEGRIHRLARTDADGNYMFENVAAGSYMARAFARGYVSQTLEDPVVVEGEQDVTGVDFILETWESPYTGIISGVVTDDVTGEPIADALVAAIAPGHGWRRHVARTHTDEFGAYSFDDLHQDAEYKIFCMAIDYNPEFFDDKLNWQDADPVTPDAADINIALTAIEVDPRTVGGQVLEDNEPVDGAIVMAIVDDEVVGAAVTFADGYYYIDGLEPDEYTLQVISPDENQGSIDISAVFSSVYDADIVLEATSVDDDIIAIPTETGLIQNYPNPFNATTNISFNLANDSEVELAVYDLLGRNVVTLVSGTLAVGAHTYTWNGLDRTGNQVSSGIYLYVLKTADQTLSNRMLLLK